MLKSFFEIIIIAILAPTIIMLLMLGIIITIERKNKSKNSSICR